MADIYEVANPPHRVPIPIVKAGDRIGKTYIPVDPAKIVAIVPCDLPDVTRALAPLDDDAERMGNNLVDFLKNEVKHGRLPENLLPLQSGVGNVANAVINGLVHSDFKNLSVYTEVIQDGMFDLIDEGKIDMISGTSLSPSPDGLKRFYANIEKYSKKIILRPQEISNNGEVAPHRRSGYEYRFGNGYLRSCKLHACNRYQTDERYRRFRRLCPQWRSVLLLLPQCG